MKWLLVKGTAVHSERRGNWNRVAAHSAPTRQGEKGRVGGAEISPRRIVFAFEAFGRSGLSWSRWARSSAEGPGRDWRRAAGTPGAVRPSDRSRCGLRRRGTWQRLAETCDDRASSG